MMSIYNAVMITQAYLKKKVIYHPVDGTFTRVLKDGSIGKTFKASKRIIIDSKEYIPYRLAWLYMTGEWPTNFIDHINRNRTDNRWSNLREATYAENNRNKSIGINNTSGYKGVSWHKRRGKYRAEIRVNGKSKHLGYFDNKEDAYASYIQAAKLYHGEFASF